ncbi:hypothetical protein M569_11830, partial [Genlisea aurea]
CSLFVGKWVRREGERRLYTNYTCKSIPPGKNCFLQGRRDADFLRWKWKPDGCDLPAFSRESFFAALRGKTMAFIGDSVAKNHMDSLLCILSKEESPPLLLENDEGDRFVTWRFPEHDFTLMVIWSPFLVTATETTATGNGSQLHVNFNLHLDEVDPRWSGKLPVIDYAIFSDTHWFLRENYLYERGELIGCTICDRQNVTRLRPREAVRRAFRTSFEKINGCKKNIHVILRTYSPPHFEHGSWNTGGRCNRTTPISRSEVDTGRMNLDIRRVQIEELELAKKAA